MSVGQMSASQMLFDQKPFNQFLGNWNSVGQMSASQMLFDQKSLN
jgi:hypothetical protein